ncbi:hypothetical protein YW5DRAFT_04980 [Streptomyces sp. Ncost-T6T-1]|uniref:hypothetical protein n=1 Tax=Streptomyces sp. Ncost-T6T-1 TaxID=1100828 RepID=UPI0008050BF3|nr:hypothetical protein [Streptomyces sp. Ncost-T6T-1]SBU95011.1 hypothetical protein YW5DRAFT_04980 [Streptomyces sp. Ncost-T6T-1]
MLQCTAVTLLPPDAVLRLTAPGADGPEDPEPYVLCELGEHHASPRTEHAAYLRPGRTPDSPALWFFWTGSGPERAHRAESSPWCPALLRRLDSRLVRRCALFDHHPAPHSWDVTDPLGDRIADRLVSGDSPEG